MKKILFSAILLAATPALAQETYQNAEIVTEDLNGTARYVGMGGAMEALGADISTIGTNPAGIGLFRKSQVSVTGGFVSQQDAGTSKYGDATNASFDQIGLVWSTRLNRSKYLNFGFNYKKSRNFNSLIDVSGSLTDASQNLNSYMNLMDASSINDYNVSQLDVLYYYGLVGDQDGNLYYNTADGYTMKRATSGYVGEYDINVSGNVSNRVYVGLTFGIMDVNYHSWSAYTESLLNSADESIGSVTVNDRRDISGTGFNIKAGVIFFPIEGSPLRIGLSVATPTWYDLTTSNYTYLDNAADTGGMPINANFASEGTYDYRVYTPWKFGVSLGHTVGNYLALGASYEFADYSSTSSRIISGYDWDGHTNTVKDAVMNEHTQQSLRGVSTLKLGAEVKPSAEFAIRVGYNYVSPMYRTEAFRDGTLYSPGTYYSSQADYTNWKSTNRITCGVGYTSGSFGIDVAYQYSVTNGEFHPFMDSSATYTYTDGTSETIPNYADGVDVSNKRHQLIATLSYKF